MRGKLSTLSEINVLDGITPAYAGKTLLWIVPICAMRDHPRVCGENAFCHWVKPLKKGSPPRMRGKLSIDVGKFDATRITPAYAGKTYKKPARQQGSRDHPRVCGENTQRSYPHVPVEGSPPQVRGKRNRKSTDRRINRITPAGAGKTKQEKHRQTNK